VEYLIAIAFLLAFVLFWFVVHHRGSGLLVRVGPLAVGVVAMGALASTCVMQQAAIPAAAVPAAEIPVLQAPVLGEMYGPATFDHKLHQAIVSDCTTCHHNSGNQIPPCSQCHTNSTDSAELGKPELAHVYHLRCISCHIEEQKGPSECSGCHQQAAVEPLSISHPLTARGDCLACHAGRISGVPEVPQDHRGASNSVCQLCHTPSPEKTSVNAVPHAVDGWQNCLLCHGEGIGGAIKVPGTDHAGRTNETCLACHVPTGKSGVGE
jgi:hypothetical protein